MFVSIGAFSSAVSEIEYCGENFARAASKTSLFGACVYKKVTRIKVNHGVHFELRLT